MMWILMRQAAIARHALLNRVFEGGDPNMWKIHMGIVRNFYGF